ncbi:acyl transferase domain-containing protein [Lipomyces kononenkoae]|uniref:Acyl transferase domain-containing protein n=1 Tax=Lipomyces kononenkoae TaxID=34357 RepID=A0ACC3SU54_LIPKO
MRDRFFQHIGTTAASDELLPQESLVELITDFLDFKSKLLLNWPGADRTSRQRLLRALLDHLERNVLTDDIHTIAAISSDDPERPAKIIRSYYSACHASDRPIVQRQSALLDSVSSGDSKLYAVLGGQGITTAYLDELREIHTMYHSFLVDYIETMGEFLKSLASQPDVSRYYPEGLDIINWLRNPEATPDVSYLASSRVSFPIIGILQLAQYMVTLKVLGQNPSTFNPSLSGIAGHSQGLVIATVIAGAVDWSSFIDSSRTAVEILFSIGVVSQQIYPETSPDPKIVSDSISNDEGTPSSMLSIRGISEAQVQEHVDVSNKSLPEDRKISIALANGPRNFVVAGPATSLCGLNARLRRFKVSAEVDQNRIPSTERKSTLTNHFLPISVPFHTNYLLPALPILRKGLGHIFLPSNSLQIPVYDTNTGEDLSALGSENLLDRLVYLITVAPVRWLKASTCESASHIVDFGPGGSSGIGVVTSQNKQGTGVRVIMAGALAGKSSEVGYKAELFSWNKASIVDSKNWARSFSPRLIRATDGQIHLETRMSKLLHMPPIMVAGMTPTTVSWRFVSATINAGYHIELAGGGYRDEAMLTTALNNIVATIPAGRGVCINIIYVDPRAVAWQIPLLEKLHAEGIPIDGLTIGAGVPSVEISQSYINDLGLKYIAFKPGSVKSIKQVIGIAKANPTFPVILQWTGGRAGGHHSFEDFHTPILEVYGQIRDCENIILVAGSGFGSAEDAYPYFTGAWSKAFGYPPMPFDGVLLGSRMMTAKEASTSVGSKKKIVETDGLPDGQWEKTFKGAAGGVITVISEMGEPMHVLATRGMRFWAEMDTIFKMPKYQMVATLQERSSYIIKKLNDDFQKVWFGKNTAGEAVLLKEMTYHEVVARMVELMYISARGVWIDKSWKTLTGDFIRRVEERFATSSGSGFVLSDYADLDAPQVVLDTLVETYPDISDDIITPLDVQFFLSLCLRPGKKPVPFVPVLDENLSFYFKKDSLWQSENLWAVVGNDADRTQILHGPVAAQHSKTYDEPVQDILDGIKNGLVSSLLKEAYNGEIRNLPVQKAPLEITPQAHWSDSERNVSITESSEAVVYAISSARDDLPSPSSWYRMIAGDQYTWRYALFSSETVISGNKRLPNPIRKICTPSSDLRVTVENHTEPSKMVITIQAASDTENPDTVVKIRLQGSRIVADCILSPTTTHVSPTLRLAFSYHPDAVYAPIRENSDGLLDEVSEFYRKLWFGDEQLDFDAQPTQDFSGETMTITREAISSFLQATGSSCETYRSRANQELPAPLDFGIVIAWKALLKPIFLRKIGGNILKLVHLSNKFKRVDGAASLSAGDKVSTSSRITAVRIQDAGKVVEVLAVITKDGSPVMEVVSQFMYRGKYTDFETTFERKVEVPMQVHLGSRKDVAILKSKPWFQLTNPDSELLDRTFIFRLETTQVKSTATAGTVLVVGTVSEKHATDGERSVASINYTTALSSVNPILRYLNTHGSGVEGPVLLENAIPVHGASGIPLKRPMSSAAYAKVSGDYNPIHVSNTFALLANLPGSIVHGMHTSSAIGSLLETWTANGRMGAVRSFEAFFVGMVLPDDLVDVEFWHTAMMKGRKVIKITAKKIDSGEMVLKGEAEVEEQRSAYLFTGQGSQEPNMGMDLYASSPIARSVWDIADKFYLKTYGFEITKIVRENPKQMTIHFGGVNGRRIRQNYLSLTVQTTGDDGQPILEKVFKDINEDSESYTFKSPKGLLHATQFTQAAITLVELARYKDMEARGLISENYNFAGHSLGEYPALASFAQIMSIEQLVAICFYRGMAMQVTVKRDEQGASDYSLCAVNPSRVSKTFNEKMLRFITTTISQQTGWLLEIVNFNISNRQYVCAGELIALDCLTKLLDRIAKGLNVDWINRPGSGLDGKTVFLSAVRSIIQEAQAKKTRVELKRGTGITPLEGIDVPFHSTLLRPGVATFRDFLASKIDPSNIDAKKLVNKWVPNLTGKPFRNDRKYFEYVYNLTGSVPLQKLLGEWREIDLVF